MDHSLKKDLLKVMVGSGDIGRSLHLSPKGCAEKLLTTSEDYKRLKDFCSLGHQQKIRVPSPKGGRYLVFSFQLDINISAATRYNFLQFDEGRVADGG